MPAERLPMRKVREVLRLKHACGASDRLIAQSVGISRSTVTEYLRRAAVIVVERFILARLRNRRFFSLSELNAAIRESLDELNIRLMRKLSASRREFFETIDQPALLPLPAEPYRYAEWKKCRVAPDYHVELYGHFYSVPSALGRSHGVMSAELTGRLIRQVLDARLTEATVELFHQGKRVAAHPRSPAKNRHTTVPDHMPSAHRRYASWTPAKVVSFAVEIGPAATALVEAIMRAKPHPEQGFRACLGILRLARTYGVVRLEAACKRGLSIGATTYGSIVSILKNGFDRAFHEEVVAEAEPVRHANIRGQTYYH